MKNLTIIAAVGKNLELGKNNDLIWHLKEDMRFFKKCTTNKPIVMGMKTLESLPRLLPNRKHIVLTRQHPNFSPDITVVHSVEEVLDFVRGQNQEVMVIGGASVYRQLLEYSDRMILTEIDQSADADVYFPSFNKEDWDREVLSIHEEKNIKYQHLVYTRK